MPYAASVGTTLAQLRGDMARFLMLANSEANSTDRLARSIDMWRTAGSELTQTNINFGTASTEMLGSWRGDDAPLFEERVLASRRSMFDSAEKMGNSPYSGPVPALEAALQQVGTTVAQVRDLEQAFTAEADRYLSDLQVVKLGQPPTDEEVQGLADALRQHVVNAGHSLDLLAQHYTYAASRVRAAGEGHQWVGPRSGGEPDLGAIRAAQAAAAAGGPAQAGVGNAASAAGGPGGTAGGGAGAAGAASELMGADAATAAGGSGLAGATAAGGAGGAGGAPGGAGQPASGAGGAADGVALPAAATAAGGGPGGPGGGAGGGTGLAGAPVLPPAASAIDPGMMSPGTGITGAGGAADGLAGRGPAGAALPGPRLPGPPMTALPGRLPGGYPQKPGTGAAGSWLGRGSEGMLPTPAKANTGRFPPLPGSLESSGGGLGGARGGGLGGAGGGVGGGGGGNGLPGGGLGDARTLRPGIPGQLDPTIAQTARPMTAPPPTTAQAPVLPGGTTAAGATAGPGGSAMPPPMMPPAGMAGAGAGGGRGGRPGSSAVRPGGTGRVRPGGPPPGVPAGLLGKAGRAEAMGAFPPLPASTAKAKRRQQDQIETLQLLDEELWTVEREAPSTTAPLGGSPTPNARNQRRPAN